MTHRVRAAAIGMILSAAPLIARQPAGVRQGVEAYVAANQKTIVAELLDLLSIPNVAADTTNIRRNATHLQAMLTSHGFAAEVLETKGNPLVFGQLDPPGATRTLLFYAHYDGQPFDPKGWKQPSAFTPIFRDGRMEDGAKEVSGTSLATFAPDLRIYARSASDDKSPIVALCAALDALKAAGLAPTSKVHIVLDGEEEAGSPSLVPAIATYRDKFAAGLMVILDGPTHPSGRPTVLFGARGNLPIDLTVYGPRFPLHSGHYGNWVPNPGIRLARLLASMKDDDGRVLVKGFYDGIGRLAPEEKAMLDAVPDDPEGLKALFGFSQPEGANPMLQEALQKPSLNVRGLSSAYVGDEARTIIPDRATAAIDIRLVPETPAAAMADKIRAHIVSQGFHIVDADPDDATRAQFDKIVKVSVRGATDAYRTSPLLPISQLVSRSLEQVLGAPPVLVRTSGGTVPIAPFIAAMQFPAISLPTVNFDNNQHAENENLRLGHFFDGIRSIAALLVMPQ